MPPRKLRIVQVGGSKCDENKLKWLLADVGANRETSDVSCGVMNAEYGNLDTTVVV